MKRAIITHLDLRTEWYPTPSEIFSLGAFFKDFQNPIETVVVVSAQHSVTFDNAKGAQNFGVEAEWRKWLGFLHPVLADYYVAGNIALISSQIRLKKESGIQTSNKRPLQGQSPYVINAEVGYNNAENGIHAVLLYNVFGPRISEVGALGAPDSYEEPVHVLDLAASVPFSADWKISFKARNLLDPEVKQTQGGSVTEVFHRGREFNVGLGWDWK